MLSFTLIQYYFISAIQSLQWDETLINLCWEGQEIPNLNLQSPKDRHKIELLSFTLTVLLHLCNTITEMGGDTYSKTLSTLSLREDIVGKLLW